MKISDEAIEEAYATLFPQDHAAGPGRMEEVTEEALEEAAETLFKHRDPYSPGSSIFNPEGRREALREQVRKKRERGPMTAADVDEALRTLHDG